MQHVKSAMTRSIASQERDVKQKCDRNRSCWLSLSLLAIAQDVNSRAQLSFPMGKQHNKNIKRSRRKQYLKRKNEQIKSSIVRKESAPAKKAVAKKAAKKAAAKKVAKKAVKKTAAKKTAKKAAKKAAPKKEES